ncbi:MAG: cyclic nucleotide-binding domain-containing protein [Cellvibrionaceae bacterium]|nr:cyclic nucleotide-binding domain-containing protein [Cellvibrionaceae bacterium]
MGIRPLHQCSQQTIDSLLGSVALYKQVYQLDPIQFDVLMRNSQLVEAKLGEVVIEAGQIDSWLYFLLRGQLVVYAGEPAIRRVNVITPGEIFGDMAILLDLPRSATVIADVRTRVSAVVRTDFSIFGEPLDQAGIKLPVKLLFYRTMVHNLRWKLEVYRAQFPSRSFAADHRKIRLYAGVRDTMDELLSLDSQARQLAELLNSWNLALTQAGDP